MVTNQSYLFLIFTLDGLVIGILFDFFRILRKSFKTSNLVTYIEDIFFWILTGLLILYSIFIFNNGEIRLFMFLGIIIGIALYMLLLSNYFIKINLFIIKVIKKLLSIILIPIKKRINIIFINTNKLTKKFKILTNKSKNMEDFKDKSRII